MADYISREAAVKEIYRFDGYLDDDMIWRLHYALRKIPAAADVRPMTEISDAVDEVLDFLNENSNCMPYHIYSALFDLVSGICPHCGADMRE